MSHRAAITKLQAALIIVLIVAVSAAGAYYYSSLTPSTGNPIRLGVEGPFTGPSARAGQNMKYSIQLAVEDAKAQGILPMTIDGVVRTDVVPVWIDDQSDPAKAVPAYLDAIQNKHVEIITGGWNSAPAVAIMKIGTQYGIIHSGSIVDGVAIMEQRATNSDAIKYFFKGGPSPPHLKGLIPSDLKYFIDSGAYKPRNLNVALLLEDTEFGRPLAPFLNDGFVKNGFTVVSQDFVPQGEVDFYPILTKYQALNVSLIFFTNVEPGSNAAFLKQVKELNLHVLIDDDGLGYWPEAIKNAGVDATDYVIDSDPGVLATPEAEAFLARYTATFGNNTDVRVYDGPITYDWAMFLLGALKQAGTLNPDKLRAAVLAFQWKGLMGTYAYDNTPGPFFQEVKVGPGFLIWPLAQYKAGQPQTIYPLANATKPFEQPPGS